MRTDSRRGIAVPTVVEGLVLAAFGLLLAAELAGWVDLRAELLWPGLVIAWGSLLVLQGVMSPDPR